MHGIGSSSEHPNQSVGNSYHHLVVLAPWGPSQGRPDVLKRCWRPSHRASGPLRGSSTFPAEKKKHVLGTPSVLLSSVVFPIFFLGRNENSKLLYCSNMSNNCRNTGKDRLQLATSQSYSYKTDPPLPSTQVQIAGEAPSLRPERNSGSTRRF